MIGQDSIAEVENEIHFQRRAGIFSIARESGEVCKHFFGF
jgi:hypothetical protein